MDKSEKIIKFLEDKKDKLDQTGLKLLINIYNIFDKTRQVVF